MNILHVGLHRSRGSSSPDALADDPPGESPDTSPPDPVIAGGAGWGTDPVAFVCAPAPGFNLAEIGTGSYGRYTWHHQPGTPSNGLDGGNEVQNIRALGGPMLAYLAFRGSRRFMPRETRTLPSMPRRGSQGSWPGLPGRRTGFELTAPGGSSVPPCPGRSFVAPLALVGPGREAGRGVAGC